METAKPSLFLYDVDQLWAKYDELADQVVTPADLYRAGLDRLLFTAHTGDPLGPL